MVGPRPQKAAKTGMPERQGRTVNAGKNPLPAKMETVETGKRKDEKNDKREENRILAPLPKRKWQQGPLGSGQNG